MVVIKNLTRILDLTIKIIYMMWLNLAALLDTCILILVCNRSHGVINNLNPEFRSNYQNNLYDVA
jgi:hypothetical protein